MALHIDVGVDNMETLARDPVLRAFNQQPEVPKHGQTFEVVLGVKVDRKRRGRS